ncbi:MAG: manganese catalase family protein [Clostridia bacterium]|nr:manganese catalase family protein [Clostridia bacterium]
MWVYEKKLEYPMKVSGPNPKLAKSVVTQYGGPDGELGASMRYLTQRYSMPTSQAVGVLTDIGTEELAHMEMVASLVYNLLKGASIQQIKAAGMDGYYADHDRSVFLVNGDGVPWIAAYIQSKGDPIADLHEDLAAEEKARATYEHLINLSDDPGATDVLRFLREREVVHFQRFGETLNLVHEHLSSRKVW